MIMSAANDNYTIHKVSLKRTRQACGPCRYVSHPCPAEDVFTATHEIVESGLIAAFMLTLIQAKESSLSRREAHMLPLSAAGTALLLRAAGPEPSRDAVIDESWPGAQ